MLEIYTLFGSITNVVNTQVALLSSVAEGKLDWRKLKYQQYNNFVNALDCSGRVREMINQDHSA